MWEDEISVFVSSANAKYEWIDRAMWRADERVLQVLVNLNVFGWPDLVELEFYCPLQLDAKIVCFTSNEVR